MVSNFKKEQIPNRESLTAKCLEHLDRWEKQPFYEHDELFDSTSSKNRVLVNNTARVLHLNGQIKEASCVRDTPGVYSFHQDGRVMYVGLSRGMLKRSKAHWFGSKKQVTSLIEIVRKYPESRPYNENGDWDTAQELVRSWKVKFLPISSSHERYLTEILLSVETRSFYNSFESH
ncbi:MAG: hypothetical protein HWD92_06565 [Flavobacteriia bacterium]|nr:hypothetical protein [Flavobacteriia bacterium]